MNEQHRTSEHDGPASDWEQSPQAGTMIDTEDDTEAHGGKIFVRTESRLDDVADRDAQPTT